MSQKSGGESSYDTFIKSSFFRIIKINKSNE